MYEIIVGRDAEDLRKFGTKGTFLFGRHYVRMGQTSSLSNDVLMDVARSHVVFVTGKRGSGKSYSLMSMAEGMMTLPEEITSKLAVVMFDTMGIYWTMKYENKRDEELIREWNLDFREISNKVYVPEGHYEASREKGIPVDAAFSIKPSELTVEDWCMAFNVELTSAVGALIGRVLSNLKNNFGVDDIIAAVQSDDRTDHFTQAAAENLFLTAKSWGLFSRHGILFSELVQPGQITIIDVSGYASAVNRASVRALVIGLISKKLFSERMQARRSEEFKAVKSFTRLIETREESKEVPLIWIFVDEAQEFLPKTGSTPATDALQTLLREGRQPGISLVLATQQPGQIHTDVMTQADIVIAHHITAKLDVDALGSLMQSYMKTGLDKALQDLPDVKGAAILFDDTNERLYPIRVRPRITWHGGSSPNLLREEKGLFSLG
ncbi:ATP-binding protein [Candidatus Woesearchaeota archaeon]|nr:ATP-binding protein [Candidatus Woesearchaeota archaeon]